MLNFSEKGNRLFHIIDRYVGIPILQVLRLLRRRRIWSDQIEVNSIGLMLFGAIGDSLLALALVEDLRRSFPAARITGFLTATSKQVASVVEGLDDIVVVPLRSPVRAVRIMRSRPMDLIIDFGQWARVNALLSASVPNCVTVGLKTDGQHRHYCYDLIAEHSGHQHEIENFRGMLRALGLVATGKVPLKEPAEGAALPSGRWIMFHPWASGYKNTSREWGKERWVELARNIQAAGGQVVITGGPADKSAGAELANSIANGALSVAGNLSLRETMRVIEQVAAVVSVNTGIMHLVAAMGKPLVALHGPTNPVRWGPLSDAAIVVGGDASEGCGFLNLGHEYPRNAPDCMALITVEKVTSALEALLSKQQPCKSKAIGAAREKADVELRS